MKIAQMKKMKVSEVAGARKLVVSEGIRVAEGGVAGLPLAFSSRLAGPAWAKQKSFSCQS